MPVGVERAASTFRLSGSSALAASVLPSPPQRLRQHRIAPLFVFPLSQLESSRPYAADQGTSAFRSNTFLRLSWLLATRSVLLFLEDHLLLLVPLTLIHNLGSFVLFRFPIPRKYYLQNSMIRPLHPNV